MRISQDVERGIVLVQLDDDAALAEKLEEWRKFPRVRLEELALLREDLEHDLVARPAREQAVAAFFGSGAAGQVEAPWVRVVD